MPCCSAVNCSWRTEKGVRLFALPRGVKNKEKAKQWIINLKRTKLPDTIYVCEKHFTPDQFENNRSDNKRPLRWNAIPTIFSYQKEKIIKQRKPPTVRCNSQKEIKKYEMPGCAVYGCKNSTTKGFSMKAFPRDPERRKLWASKVGRGDWQPTDRSTICEAHFEEHMWEKVQVDGKKKLKCTAVPTIFNFSTPTTRRNKQSNKPVITIASSCKKKSFLEKSPTYVDLNEPSTSSTLTRAKTSAQSDNIKSSFVKAAKKDIRRKAKPSLQIYRRRFNTLFKKYKLCKNFLENSKKKIINLEKEVQTLKKSNLELENTLLLRSLLTDEQISAIKKNTQVVVVSLPHLKMKPVCIKFPK